MPFRTGVTFDSPPTIFFMVLPPAKQTSLFDIQASFPRVSERLIVLLLILAAALPILAVGAIVYIFAHQSWLFFQDVSFWHFLTDTQWTPRFSSRKFGIFVIISATLLVSIIAMIVAVPIGLLSAIYLSECAPTPVRSVIRPLLDSLSGVPTIVYGYFALLLVTPYLQKWIPALSTFNGLSAGLVTGLLITPIIASFSEDALQNVDKAHRQAAYACGLTQFEFIWKILLPEAFPGIMASFTLAASRALGETMIAAIAAGQNPALTMNPLVPIETMTGFIVQVSLGNPTKRLYPTIFVVGTVLFLITLLLNGVGNWLVYRHVQTVEGQRRPTADVQIEPDRDNTVLPIKTFTTTTFAPTLLRRLWINRLFTILGLISSLVGPVFLGILTLVTLRLGLSQLNWSFLTSFTSSDPEKAGILAALAGTLWLLSLTTLLALPIGLAAAIYLEEYIPESFWSRLVEVNLANATAIPGILYGLLGLVVFAEGLRWLTGGRTILAAAFMMTLLVLPLLITTSRAALRQVPTSLKRGGYAIGMSRWQVVWHIVLPAARPGLLTGILLTASRIVGETSPLIALGAVEFITFVPNFTVSGLQSPFTTLTTQIFFWLSLPQTVFQQKAAAAVIVLGTLVLVMNGTAALVRDRIQRVS